MSGDGGRRKPWLFLETCREVFLGICEEEALGLERGRAALGGLLQRILGAGAAPPACFLRVGDMCLC